MRSWRGEPPSQGPYLRLSPARHGTDGFFLAVLAKAKPAAKPEAEPRRRKRRARPEETEP